MSNKVTPILHAIFYVALALLLCAGLFEAAGFSSLLMFQSIAEGAFTSTHALAGSLRWAMPLFLTAIGVVMSFRCGYFNVGAQGQFYLGAIAAGFAIEGLNGAPAVIVIPAAMLAGLVGGALWAAWPALLRIFSGTDEVITTLMGNFLAGLALIYVSSGPLKDPSGTGQVMASRPIDAAYRISDSGGLSLTIVVVVIVVGALAWLLVNRTPFGVLSRLAGRNPVMVLWQGAPLARLALTSFLLSGALAGLAGSIELLGPNGRLVSGFLPAHGFTAILIALVAGLSVPGVAAAAIFFGGLASANLYLPVIVGLPAAAIDVLNAAIAIFITARASLPVRKWLLALVARRV